MSVENIVGKMPLSDMPHLPDDEFEKVWNPPRGLKGWFTAVQNSPIGMRFVAVSMLFFVLGGINALVMRTQLAQPNLQLLDPEAYNRLMTMHGSTMMFLFAVPLIEGIATLVLPQMLGSRELPYPRLTAFSFWAFLWGGLIFYAGFLVGEVPTNGWFAYAPLSSELQYSPGKGMDFWLLGLNVAEIGAIAGAFEIIIAILMFRAPGMTLSRIPIFAWAMLVTAFMMIFGFTPLVVGSMLMEFDRKFFTNFYDPTQGGSPLLWQHVFWIFGHPDVYIQFIPAAGMVSSIIPVFSRRPLVGYKWVVISLVATGFMSFGLWVHHMFATGLPELTLSFFAAISTLIAIPSGVQIFAWIATIWSGRPVFKTPFLFILGFFFIFVLGGLTGVMVAVVPFDLQVHDSFFVVAHFHYVLIGGMVFPIFGAFYYWAPKFINKMLDERLGKLNFWLMFIGFNVAFFPMHISGLMGMPRRVYTYADEPGLGLLNLISTIGAFMVALGVFVFLLNVFRALRSTELAPANPWGADSLEWGTPTPVMQYGYRRLPIVTSRHPLWQQASIHQGADEKTEALVEELVDYPVKFRAQLVVSVLDAEPKEVIRVAGPSVFPFVVGTSAMIFSLFGIYDNLIGMGVCLLIVIGGLIGWHWQDFAKPARRTQRDEQFEAKHGIPVRAQGSNIVSRFTMILTIMTIGIVLFTLLFCYFYLRLDAPQWPPAGTALPDITLPAAATGLLILMATGMFWIVRRELTPLLTRAAFLISAVIAITAAVIWGIHLLNAPFSHEDHAYGSIYAVLVIYQIGLIISAGGIGIVHLLMSWQPDDRDLQHRYEGLQDDALYWYFVAVSGTLVFLTLIIFPRLL